VHPPPAIPFPTGPIGLDDDPHLRDALRRCPAPTFEAACAYRKTGDSRHVPTILYGVIARFVEPELRSRMSEPADDLRLVEDLGLDSLSLMEVALLAEDVLRISISAEELRQIRTIADVRQFVEAKVRL
jgi:acyl carrier protein